MGGNGRSELTLLGVAVLIGLAQLVWGATAAQMQRGFAWGMGSRDEQKPVTGVAARLQRAMVNYLETFPLFAAALLAAVALGRTGEMTLLGAWLYVVGRAVYVPLYASGVPVLRSVIWGIAMLGIALELAAVLG